MFPLSDQPTWAIKDSSKLDDYQRCHRYFFYRHILGWTSDSPAHDLHFGESYHKAREHQLMYGYSDLEGAYQAFIEHYRLQFPPETDDMYLPKTPTAVLNALLKFNLERSNDLVENEVVILDQKKMLEISGTVPVDEKRVLHYRMDSIMRRLEDGKIFSWDHKTTSEKYIISNQWANQFFLSIQNGTYTHCLYCMFHIEEVLGIEFCGTGFAYLSRGSANRPAGYHVTLRRVPVFKTPGQMNVWLWTVNNLLDEIERDMDRLYHSSDNDEVLMAFPMNNTGCTSYRGCQYHDYCCCWSNPLRSCEEPPLGFREEFWNPAEKKANIKLDLEYPFERR